MTESSDQTRASTRRSQAAPKPTPAFRLTSKPRKTKTYWLGWRAGFTMACAMMHTSVHELQVSQLDKWRQHDLKERK